MIAQKEAPPAVGSSAGAEVKEHGGDATETADERKAIATLQALAALGGVRVDPIEIDDGRQVYIVSRWSLTRQCDTLAEVRALLKRMGIAV